MRIVELEKQRSTLLQEIQTIRDMRSGTISVRYQRCSNAKCICHSKGHVGHGPIYSYSTLKDGKTKIKNYKLSPELLKLQKEVAQYQRFKVITQKLISLNNEICELRPVSEVQDTRELESLKKKLEKQFRKRSQEK